MREDVSATQPAPRTQDCSLRDVGDKVVLRCLDGLHQFAITINVVLEHDTERTGYRNME